MNFSLHESNHSETYRNEIHNYKSVLENTLTTAERKIEQLIPNQKLRKRRGLINGLGSIIKSLTGNLDQEDAVKYDHKIEQLFTSQNKLTSIITKQISLTNNAMSKFNKTISALTINERMLKSKIDQIEFVMQGVKFSSQDTANMLLLSDIFNQLIAVTQSLINALNEIESAVTFARLNILYPGIIEPYDFLSELKNINSIIKHEKLPYEPKPENIVLLEKTTIIKSYLKNSKLTFLIEIPLTENKLYYYHQLFMLPIQTKIKYHYQVIIPKSKFLLINEQYYALSNVKCRKMRDEDFICDAINLSPISQSSPCEVQLLQFTNMYHGCQKETVKIQEEKIHRLSTGQWIVIEPETVIATKKCQQEQEKLSLEGSYLVTLAENCQLVLNGTTLTSYPHTEMSPKLVQLPNLKNGQFQEYTEVKSQPIHFESTDLDDFQQIKADLTRLENNANGLHESNVYFHRTSGWTIFLYLIIILAAIFVLLWKCRNRKINEQNPEKMENRRIPVINFPLGKSEAVRP